MRVWFGLLEGHFDLQLTCQLSLPKSTSALKTLQTLELFEHEDRRWWLVHCTHWPPRPAMTGGFTVNWLIVAEK